MGMRPNNGRMEGWLYTIRSNRFGLQFSRKRYFILEENYLKFYKTIPTSQNEEPVRSAIIDSCIRITDNGRESINRKVFFIFTLYSTLNYNDQLKLGASSSEDAAGWIRSLQNAVLKECPNPGKDFVASSNRKWPPLRLSVSKRVDCKGLVDFYSSMHTEATTSDVIAPSPWKIFGCQNGLRLFKEAKDWDSQERHWDEHPAIMAVGVVDGTSEAIFRTLMSLGPLRSEWDFCSYRGSTVEHLDGHTDIIHKQLYRDLLPRGMKRRDLLLRRYWRREDDGTYVILYHSVIHKKCPPQKGYVRACLKSGGYVITPISQGRRSIVKHMLAVNWRSWKLYILPSCEKSITIRMLERVAALRELFQAKEGNYTALSPRELTGQVVLPQTEKADVEVKAKGEGKIEEEPNLVENEAETLSASLTALNSASDEFYDVPDTNEMMDFDLENEWSSEMSPETHTASMLPPRLSSAAGKVKKKLHDFAVQKKGYMDLQESTKEDGVMCSYGATLQKDPNYTLPCSWAAADPSTFLIRGKNYLKDNEKVKAKGTLMQIVGADWLRSNRPESDLGSRPDSIVQSYAVQDRPEFFFIVNIQGETEEELPEILLGTCRLNHLDATKSVLV
ncbi:hypothetical protein MANES_10G046900v8 [Manihot esculenta]|uniref:Uncharacterized protein n=1 Tax=Manihot esculenta TaxID=3983 RepID=A0ACB7GZF2_MANES|nr:hypothetical protein MANES_10G046900v8 [Manihot esculenta]